MTWLQISILGLFLFSSISATTQEVGSNRPDINPAPEIQGMKLVWADEFSTEGKPNPEFWKFEKGFVRNEELQWYREENAHCTNGVLVIEGRREEIPNPKYQTFKIGNQLFFVFEMYQPVIQLLQLLNQLFFQYLFGLFAHFISFFHNGSSVQFGFIPKAFGSTFGYFSKIELSFSVN